MTSLHPGLIILTLCLLDRLTVRGLQLVQNAAARPLTGTKERDHITPVLASLRCLTVRFRTDSKTQS